jgi:hypothetical protein
MRKIGTGAGLIGGPARKKPASPMKIITSRTRSPALTELKTWHKKSGLPLKKVHLKDKPSTMNYSDAYFAV